MAKNQYVNKDKSNDVELKGTYIEVRNNDIGRAMRKLKKRIQEEGIMQELRDRQHFEKPSIKRKKAKAAARSRWLKKLSQSQD